MFSRTIAAGVGRAVARVAVAPLVMLLLLLPASEWAAATPPALPADSISYGYDPLGRLTTVVDPNAASNGVATYAYDAVGNLTSIGRSSSASVSVVQLSPIRGAVGSKVVIYGTGFSSTPVDNSVSFAGTAASVATATTTQLHVTVPSGAATGLVSVTTPSGSASSAAPFTVSSSAQAPDVATVAPAIADVGTTVTLTGSRLGTDPSAVSAAIGQVRGKVVSATSTGLTFTVPPVATSGKVLVATSEGSGQSSVDLFVPPRGFSSSQIVATGRRRSAR